MESAKFHDTSDHALFVEGRTAELVAKLLLSHRESASPQYVLDIGCGSGWATLFCSHLGHSVHAFDVSPALVELTKQRCLSGTHVTISGIGEFIPRVESSPAKIWIGDAIKASNYVSGPYDLILCLGKTINFLQEIDRPLTLISSAINAGGVIVLEIENKDNPRIYIEAFWHFLRGRLSSKSLLSLLLTFFQSSVKIQRQFLARGKKTLVPMRLYRGHFLVKKIAAAHSQKIRIISPDWLENVTGMKTPVTGFVATLQSKLSGRWPFNMLGTTQILITDTEENSW